MTAQTIFVSKVPGMSGMQRIPNSRWAGDFEGTKGVSQGEPTGARFWPQHGVTVDANRQPGEGNGTMALETADLDPNSILLLTHSLAIPLPVSKPQYLHPQNGDNHTSFIGLCGI